MSRSRYGSRSSARAGSAGNNHVGKRTDDSLEIDLRIEVERPKELAMSCELAAIRPIVILR
jgi:hypothetical protein